MNKFLRFFAPPVFEGNAGGNVVLGEVGGIMTLATLV